MMKVEYHRATVTDLNDAVSYYEFERVGFGIEFRSEIYRAIDRIAESPRQYPIVSEDIRRCLINRFPFSILYRITLAETVRVLAIRHHRRRTSFGGRRR